MLFFLLLSLAAAATVPKKDEVPMEPSPLDQEEVRNVMLEVIVMQPKEVKDEEVIMDNLCPLGSPFWGACEVRADCPRGFECRGNQRTNSKVCCLQNDDLAMMTKCPVGETLTKNDYCQSDDECGLDARCHKDFVLPKELIDDIDAAAAEEGKAAVHLGVCCTKEDQWPVAMQSCPAGYKPSRLAPCGLGIPEGCVSGSACMNPKGWFGRCCADEKKDLKTEQANYYGRRGFGYGGYRGFGGYRGYSRFGYGGYGAFPYRSYGYGYGYPYSYGFYG